MATLSAAAILAIVSPFGFIVEESGENFQVKYSDKALGQKNREGGQTAITLAQVGAYEALKAAGYEHVEIQQSYPDKTNKGTFRPYPCVWVNSRSLDRRVDEGKIRADAVSQVTQLLVAAGVLTQEQASKALGTMNAEQATQTQTTTEVEVVEEAPVEGF